MMNVKLLVLLICGGLFPTTAYVVKTPSISKIQVNKHPRINYASQSSLFRFKESINGGSDEQRKSLAKRLFYGSFGRLWKAWTLFIGFLVVTPAETIRLLLTGSITSTKEEPEVDTYHASTTTTSTVNNQQLEVTNLPDTGTSTSTSTSSNSYSYSPPATSLAQAVTIAAEAGTYVSKEDNDPTTFAQASVVENDNASDASVALAVAEQVTVPLEQQQQQQQQQVEKIPSVLISSQGERWDVSAPGIDLSGKWKIVVSEDFKKQYDEYLRNLGQPAIVRSIATSIVEWTREELRHENNELFIRGLNVRGIWERTLISSSSSSNNNSDNKEGHARVPVLTADGEKIDAVAWWENQGTAHRSWMLGSKKYGGGDFESLRYLQKEGDEDVLVCESTFHPNDNVRTKANLTWRFKRET